MLKGIAASAGIAIAKVYKLETPSFEIVKTEATPAEEVAKFNAALEKRNLISKVSRNVPQNVWHRKSWQFLMLT